MSLRRGDTGDEVERVQKMLEACGYALPRWGADGSLGSETLSAFARFMTQHAAERDEEMDVIDDHEIAILADLHARLTVPLAPPVNPSMFHDRTRFASTKDVERRRPWSEVTGITLHQTACLLGETPQRWDTIGTHLGVTRGGRVILLHEFNWIVWHGNGWNDRCVGIEMDGHYEGVEGDLRTYWRPKTEPNRQPLRPTSELIEATEATVRWICSVVARHGGQIKYLVAHRQSIRDRQSDPGSALWRSVALPMQRSLGLTDGGEDFKIGTGMTIPEAWNPEYKGNAY